MNRSKPAPECVWPVAAAVGEGPMWSAHDEAVWFVDIKGPRVHRLDTRTGVGTSCAAPSAPGFIVPAADGRFICGLKTGLHWFDPVSGVFDHICEVEPSQPGNRLNDACVDAKGRLWFGSMDDAEKNAKGYLYLCARDGLRPSDGPYVVTNGPALSADARTLYHIDTFGQTAYAFDVADDGSLSGKRVFVHIDEANVWPDGPVVDAEGCVWIALWGGWAVNRYDSRGRLIESVSLPCANVTKAAFGGADLCTLYITTARQGLSPVARAEQPLAGGLFALRLATPGLPQQEVRDFPL